MRYGLSLPTGGACGDPRFLVELSTLAERSGWEGVFLEDYLWYQGDSAMATCDSWVALAAIAMRTTALVLGIEVVALPRRRPWKVAREAAGIDQLSGGRLILGFGSGDRRDPGFSHVGEEVDPRIRNERLDEGLEVVAGLWAGEPFSYRGRHFAVDEVTFRPTPLQRPRIPIWIGGTYPNEAAIARSLRWDGSCLYRKEDGHLTADDVRDLRGRAGDREWTISVGGEERRADWDAEREQIAAIAAAGADWWIEWVAPADPDRMTAAIERGPLRAD